jgi:hypothetical protein
VLGFGMFEGNDFSSSRILQPGRLLQLFMQTTSFSHCGWETVKLTDAQIHSHVILGNLI